MDVRNGYYKDDYKSKARGHQQLLGDYAFMELISDLPNN